MKKFFSALFCALLMASGSVSAQSNSYGLPTDIQDGNILHCFNWTINEVKANLPKIAEAGFGAVQLSPLQRRNVYSSAIWYDLYRPYDYAFQETNNVMGTSQQLTDLCNEAHKLGIKVIVDVVANHVDKANGYYDPWWKESTSRYRSWGGNSNINYNSRNSITHDRLGDYVEINTSNSEVIARAKAYIQWLKDHGVDGCRWDAAKHIELPSEGSPFWAEVTSVAGMWHYGEILGTPGAMSDNNNQLMLEYAKYMSVTDSRYSDSAAESNGGLQTRKNGEWAPVVGADKVVYWGETHDTFSNTPDYGGWSNNKSQEMIDRAYAAVACRDGATALYLSRPNTTNTGQMRIVKGSDHYQQPPVAEVNKFRNKMNGRSEFFSLSEDGNAVSITRNNGGAVIVRTGSGNFSVPNGGSLCPVGTYTDRVSGNTITVTATTISGSTGSSGIVVIYNDNLADPDPNAPQQDFSGNTMTVYLDNSDSQWPAVYCHYYGGASQSTWPGVKMEAVNDNIGRSIFKVSVPISSNGVFNAGSDANKTVDVSNMIDGHVYRVVTPKNNNGSFDVVDDGRYSPNGVSDGKITVYYDNSDTGYTDPVYCYYWGGATTKNWPGDPTTKVKDNIYTIRVPEGSNIIFTQQDGKRQTVNIEPAQDGHLYHGLPAASGNNDYEDLGLYDEASVDDIFADDNENAPVEYYNLQGIRVQHPVSGFYIKRQGTKTQKIFIR